MRKPSNFAAPVKGALPRSSTRTTAFSSHQTSANSSTTSDLPSGRAHFVSRFPTTSLTSKYSSGAASQSTVVALTEPT